MDTVSFKRKSAFDKVSYPRLIRQLKGYSINGTGFIISYDCKNPIFYDFTCIYIMK